MAEENKGTTIDETVSIDEAVGYGFNMLKGIAKYIIYIIILNVIGFFLFVVSAEEGDFLLLIIGIPFIVAGIILNIALSIGVLYKLWVDILARSRK
jgi:magnesium-transporting ATPase (P-type)